jgi:ferredoxin
MPIVVRVDAKKCGANGQCWEAAPDAFALGPDTVAKVQATEFSPPDLPKLRAAEESCPTGAITVTES